MKRKIIFLSTLYFIYGVSNAMGDFFINMSDKISDNKPRLSYGVAVTDINKDGADEFIVTGFGYPNLALKYESGKLINVVNESIFQDSTRSSIGVAACDIDGDGYEEIYVLNTDSYSGQKKYTDRLLDIDNELFDLFELARNQFYLNLTAGRSVICVDRKGNGDFGFYVANYGGPTRFYEMRDNIIVDVAEDLNVSRVIGGRAVVSGHIVSNRVDIFAANERGPNFLYKNDEGSFVDVALEFNVQDVLQNGRGTSLADVLYRGRLDIVTSNWEGFHRIFTLNKNSFADIATLEFREPSKIRTTIVADFDNDGYDEIFLNNIGEPNKLFKILEEGNLQPIQITEGLESTGLGTGAAVADIDNDGVLELLIAHGESAPEPLSMYKAEITGKSRFVRIRPLNFNNAPARGATVVLNTNLRQHAKTIDSGSGYLCQMEPVAHFGLREGEIVDNVIVQWTNGENDTFSLDLMNKTYIFKQNP